jgi:hypothetical protein
MLESQRFQCVLLLHVLANRIAGSVIDEDRNCKLAGARELCPVGCTLQSDREGAPTVGLRSSWRGLGDESSGAESRSRTAAMSVSDV